MAVDKISNWAVWQAFFAAALAEQFRAFVHCKSPTCVSSMINGPPPLQLVPTVHNEYCSDLVTPMNQLISSALMDDHGSGNDLDKFVFVSDSSLPAKPFSYVYRTLTQRHGSAFCVFPASGWAEIPNYYGGVEIAVKFHQWIILERSAAKQSEFLWTAGEQQDLAWTFDLNNGPVQKSFAAKVVGQNNGCLDEFWHMAALFGTLECNDPTACSPAHLHSFVNSPLQVSPAAAWQGQCDTFVLWPQFLHFYGDNNAFDALYASLDKASVPNSGSAVRPGWWEKISSTGIRRLRESSFLFARKFIDNPQLTDGPNFAEAYIANALKE